MSKSLYGQDNLSLGIKILYFFLLISIIAILGFGLYYLYNNRGVLFDNPDNATELVIDEPDMPLQSDTVEDIDHEEEDDVVIEQNKSKNLKEQIEAKFTKSEDRLELQKKVKTLEDLVEQLSGNKMEVGQATMDAINEYLTNTLPMGIKNSTEPSKLIEEVNVRIEKLRNQSN